MVLLKLNSYNFPVRENLACLCLISIKTEKKRRLTKKKVPIDFHFKTNTYRSFLNTMYPHNSPSLFFPCSLAHSCVNLLPSSYNNSTTKELDDIYCQHIVHSSCVFCCFSHNLLAAHSETKLFQTGTDRCVCKILGMKAFLITLWHF